MPEGAANTDEVAGISIGLRADTSALKAGLAEAKSELNKGIPAEKVVRIKALLNTRGIANEVNRVKRDIAEITNPKAGPIPIDLHFKTTKTGVQKLRSDVRRTLTEAGGINVPIHFQPNAAEANRLRGEVQKTLEGITAHVNLTWGWADGHGPRLPRGIRPFVGPPGGGTSGEPPEHVVTPGTVRGGEALAPAPSVREQRAAQEPTEPAAPAENRAEEDALDRALNEAKRDIARSRRTRRRRAETAAKQSAQEAMGAAGVKAEKTTPKAGPKETTIPEANREREPQLNVNELIRKMLADLGGTANKQTGQIEAPAGSPLAPFVAQLNARLDAARRRLRLSEEEREARPSPEEGRGIRGRAARLYGRQALKEAAGPEIIAEEKRRASARERQVSRRALGAEGEESKRYAGQQRDMDRLLERFAKVREGLGSESPTAVGAAKAELNKILGFDVEKATELLGTGRTEEARALGEDARQRFLQEHPRLFRRLRAGKPVRSYAAEVRWESINSLLGSVESAQADAEKQVAAQQAARQGADTRMANAVIRKYQVEHGLRPRSEGEQRRIERERLSEEQQGKRASTYTSPEGVEVTTGAARLSVGEEALQNRRVALSQRARELPKEIAELRKQITSLKEKGEPTKDAERTLRGLERSLTNTKNELKGITAIFSKNPVVPRAETEKGRKGLAGYEERVRSAQAEYDRGLAEALEEDRQRRLKAKEAPAEPVAHEAPVEKPENPVAEMMGRPEAHGPDQAMEEKLINAARGEHGKSDEYVRGWFGARGATRTPEEIAEDAYISQLEEGMFGGPQSEADLAALGHATELPGMRMVKGGKWQRTEPGPKGQKPGTFVPQAEVETAMAAEAQKAGPPTPPGGAHTGLGGGGVVNVRVVNPNDIAAALRSVGVAGASVNRGGQPVPFYEMEANFQRAVDVGPAQAAEEMGASFRETPTRRRRATGVTRRRAARLPTLAQAQAALEEEGMEPAEIAEMLRRGVEQRAEGERELATSRQQTVEQLQFIASRSIPTAALQAGQQAVGGRGERLAAAQSARHYQALAAQQERARQRTSATITLVEHLRDLSEAAGDDTGVAKYSKQLEGLNQQLAAQAKLRDDFIAKSEEYNKKIGGLGAAIKNIGVGTVFSIGGTLAWTTAFSAAIGTAALATKVFGPAADKLIGYAGAQQEATNALATATRQAQGSAQTAVAATLAQQGFSAATAATISPVLEQRAALTAGNEALQEQVNTLHVAQQFAQGNAGFLQPPGGIQGLTRGTGGFLGTPLFQTPSTLENIVQTIPGGNRGENFLQNIAGFALGGGLFQDQVKQALFGTAPGGEYPALRSTEGQQYAKNLAVSDKQGFEDYIQKLTDAGEQLDNFNKDAEKAGSSLKILPVATGKAGDALVAASEAALKAAGASDEDIKAFQTLGVALVDTSNGISSAINKDQAQQYLQAVSIGASQIDPALLIKQLTDRILPARFEAIRAQGQFQRQQQLPAQLALQLAAQPFTPFGTGFSLQGVDQRTQGRIGALASLAGGAQQQLGQLGPQSALMNLVPSDLQGQFSTILGQITDTGQAIAQIQHDVTAAQVGQQTAEYTNQLRIAKRSWQDIKDEIAGINGEQGKSLGLIEGQNIALQRQAQSLQLQSQGLALGLQQRQINFQVATAAFTTPGASPEERAARMEEAKAEAAYAQQQLDIQKQLYGIAQQQVSNEIAAQNMQLSRQLTDVEHQIALMEGARSVAQFSAAAGEALDRLNRKQQALVDQASTYIDEGTQAAQTVISAAQQAAEQSGKSFTYILSQTANAWGIFGKQAQMILEALMNTAPTDTYTGQPVSSGAGPHAAGYLGTVSSATGMIVGEAGPETVAVLRNPKQVISTMLGGGGSVTMPPISISVSGNTFSGPAQEAQVARLIAAEVEKIMSRKASLLGFRRPQ